MTPLTITSRDAATGPVLEIAGDIDHTTAPHLREVVDRLTLTPGQRVVLDLAGLEFCDSSGITVVLAARYLAGEAGARVVMAALPADTACIMKLVGLDQIFTIHPDVHTATTPDPAPAPATAAGNVHPNRLPERAARPAHPCPVEGMAAHGTDNATNHEKGSQPQ